jgi:hypothetical protein
VSLLQRNGGNVGGGCDTAMAAGIDADNNQLKVAMNNGRGRPRGGGRGHDRRRPWFPCNFRVSFFAFAFCKECGWGTTQSVW